MNFSPQRFLMQILAQEDRLRRSAQLEDGLVGGVLEWTPRKALKNGSRIGRPQSEGRGVFDQLVVLLADQVPADRPREDCLEVRMGYGRDTCNFRSQR